MAQRLQGWFPSHAVLPDRTVYVCDGSTLALPYSAELSRHYPPHRNQKAASHWPLLRLVVLQDAQTGLAVCPQWGPETVSEQELALRAIAALPAGAVLVGDRNFGVFGVASTASRHGHDVIVRLTKVRAERLAGGPLQPGCDKPLTWTPTRWDACGGPYAAQAAVRGRLLCLAASDPKQTELVFLFTTLALPADKIAALYALRWNVGVSRKGHMVQSVRDRPRLKDSSLVAGEAPWRESKTAEPSDNMLGKECAQRIRLQCAVNVEVASLHVYPVAETVYDVRKQQELTETSPIRRFSPAGYQRRHDVKDDVETGEALDARRRKLAEEVPAITAIGKCRHRHQGGGSGRSTVDGRAAKRVRREGPGPVSTPSGKVRQG